MPDHSFLKLAISTKTNPIIAAGHKNIVLGNIHDTIAVANNINPKIMDLLTAPELVIVTPDTPWTCSNKESFKIGFELELKSFKAINIYLFYANLIQFTTICNFLN